jgi:hypothetical protein
MLPASRSRRSSRAASPNGGGSPTRGLYRAYDAVATRPYQQVYAVVRGDTTPRGYAGHLGLYQRYLRIHEVVSVSEVAQQQTAGAARCPEAVHGP